MRPKIVCLCGSTTFVNIFDDQMLRLTLEGYIVLTLGSHRPRARQLANDTGGHKAKLDEMHKHKINLADEIFVINIGGYIGESTASEIDHANKQGKPVNYLEEIL